jgi:hypothetical protein
VWNYSRRWTREAQGTQTGIPLVLIRIYISDLLFFEVVFSITTPSK